MTPDISVWNPVVSCTGHTFCTHAYGTLQNPSLAVETPQRTCIILIQEMLNARNGCRFQPSAWIPILFWWSRVRFNNTTWAGRDAIERKLLSGISVPKTDFQVHISDALYCKRLEASDSHSLPFPPCYPGDFFSLSYYIFALQQKFYCFGTIESRVGHFSLLVV